MPGYGLIPDSPWIYAVQKAAHSKGVRALSKSIKGNTSTFSFGFRFSKLIIYKPILNFELTHQEGMVGRHLSTIGHDIVVGAKLQAHMRTGQLRNSIKMEHIHYPTGAAIKVGSTVSYALLHHEGSKPHVITPKNGEFLKFGKGTRVVYARQVMHPGTKPNRYLSDQLRIHVRG
jgi:hypothetical protein